MQLLAPPPDRDDQRCLFQQLEVLRHGLASHVQVFAKLSESLPVVGAQSVEQQSAAGVSKRLEYFVRICVHACYYAANGLHVNRRRPAALGIAGIQELPVAAG